MAVPALMIGIMKCKISNINAGSVKNASLTIKPQYKEHKTSYLQLSDLKALFIAESICKVDTEENILSALVVDIAKGLSLGLPIEVPFEAIVPGLGGIALKIIGNGFGSASSIFGKMEDFGYCGVESTSINIELDSNVGSNFTLPFIVPDSTAQAITIDTDNLLYGAPTVFNDLCKEAQFQSSSKTRYLSSTWPPTLEAAVLENTDFVITASFLSSKANLLNSIIINSTPGSILPTQSITLQVPTINKGNVEVTIGTAVIEPDLSFSPGNDWNGISVKCSAVLSNPLNIGTNWAQIS